MQILSWLNAANWSSQGSTQNRAEKASKRKNKLERAGQSMFAVVPGSTRNRYLKPGVYLQTKVDKTYTIRPVLLFVRSVSYQKRLDWYGAAQRCVDANFAPIATAAIERAIATARG